MTEAAAAEPAATPEASTAATPDAATPAAAVAAPVAPPTPPAKPGAPRIHDVMREREELAQTNREQAKRLKALESEAGEYKSKHDAWRKDPYAAAKELGINYQELTQRVARGDSPLPLTADSVQVAAMKAEMEAMRAELGGVKSAAEKRAEAEAAAETAAYQRKWIDTGKQFVESAADKYEYLKASGMFDLMAQEAQTYEQEHGEAPSSYEPIAAIVDTRMRGVLEGMAPQLAKIPGFAKLIAEHANAQTQPAESATERRSPSAMRAPVAATPQRPMLTTKAASAASRSQGESTEHRPKARWSNKHARREQLFDTALGKR